MTLLYEPVAPTESGRKRWTVDDCRFLENAGLLKGGYELLDGEIIVRMVQYGPHSKGVSRCTGYCYSLFGLDRTRSQTTVEVVLPVDRITNQPEPDVIVLREGTEDKRLHTTADVLLIIEVSDTTVSDDYGWKARLYARNSVPEYWVLDVNRRLLIRFRQPNGDEWLERDEFSEADTVSCLAAPQALILVANLLP